MTDPDWLASEMADEAPQLTEGKQVSRVFAAVQQGAETSDQVSAMTGLPIAQCSVWLGQLARDGMIELKARNARQYHHGGPKSHVYGLKSVG